MQCSSPVGRDSSVMDLFLITCTECECGVREMEPAELQGGAGDEFQPRLLARLQRRDKCAVMRESTLWCGDPTQAADWPAGSAGWLIARYCSGGGWRQVRREVRRDIAIQPGQQLQVQ